MNKFHLSLRILLFGMALAISPGHSQDTSKPRVIVTLDACLSCGNPSDIHALVHLLWHSNEIELLGLLPDRYDVFGNPEGMDAFEAVFKAYESDFNDPETLFASQGLIAPASLEELLPSSHSEALATLIGHAKDSDARPLYVLGWGNMRFIQEALGEDRSILEKLRLITVATRTNYNNCREPNLNGWGREAIFRDFANNEVWWLEMDWTQEAIEEGEERVQLLDAISQYGELGEILDQVSLDSEIGKGFRAGDTVPLLYLLDPASSPSTPTRAGSIGTFIQPFPELRPNYYTDFMGSYEWDYEKPCRTWIDRALAKEECQATLRSNRSKLFADLMARLNGIYPTQTKTRSLASYEAENADLTDDLEVKSDLEASHGFYVEMKGNGRITWVLDNVPSAGEYTLQIRYKLPFHHKTQKLIVNGSEVGTVKFDGNPRTWQEKEFTVVLHEGDNTVSVEKDWGYMDFDNAVLALNQP